MELQRTRADIFIIFYRGHLDVDRSSVEDPRASIKEKQDKHAKNVAGALKKRRTGKGNVKKLVNFPGKHFRSCIFFTFKWNFDALAAALAMHHRNNFLVLPHIFLRRNYDINK